MLSLSSPFGDLMALWQAELELRDLADGTKQSYRDQMRLHVLPAFEHFTLGEITTGRVEWFLKSEASTSYSRARQSRSMLNLLFGFALRHDAISRNPVEGTSSLRTSKTQPQALTLEQIAAIRVAAANWRTGRGRPGPKPDGQVRDIVEVLLGTAMRPGEVLALRPCDVEETPNGMVVVSVTGTVVQRKGNGTVRQARPKSDASIRRILVPEFAATVLRRRLTGVPPERTVFASRSGGPLSPYNVRRTFREFLADAGLGLRDQSALVPAYRSDSDRPWRRQRRRSCLPRTLVNSDNRGPLHRARPDRRRYSGGSPGTNPPPREPRRSAPHDASGCWRGADPRRRRQ